MNLLRDNINTRAWLGRGAPTPPSGVGIRAGLPISSEQVPAGAASAQLK